MSVVESRRSRTILESFDKTYFESDVPRWLYRYYGLGGERLEWVRRLLAESDLYFTRSSSFNDPFDCRIALDFHASDLQIEQFARRAAKNVGKTADKKRIKEVKRKRFSTNGQIALTGWVTQAVERQGFVCLSELPNNPLMWAHYGDKHRGVCIRFNMDVKYRFDLQIGVVRVKYVTDLPKINFFKTGDPERMYTIIGTKSDVFEYEKEWRMIKMRESGYVRIHPGMVDGVILGWKTSSADERQITEWIRTRPIPTELFRIEPKKDSFELLSLPANRRLAAST